MLFAIAFSVFLPIIWLERKKFAVTSVGQLLLIDAAMIVCGPLTIALFWNGCNFLFPGILHSGIFGLFFFGPFFMLACARLMRRSAIKMIDLFACLMSLYQIMNRTCCYFTGCCRGNVIPGSVLRWPVREAEQIFFSIMFIVLWRMYRKDRNNGLLFPILTIGYGCFRFINEWFSEGNMLILGIQIAHIWSVLTIIVGLSMYFEIKTRAEDPVRDRAYRRG